MTHFLSRFFISIAFTASFTAFTMENNQLTLYEISQTEPALLGHIVKQMDTPSSLFLGPTGQETYDYLFGKIYVIPLALTCKLFNRELKNKIQNKEMQKTLQVTRIVNPQLKKKMASYFSIFLQRQTALYIGSTISSRNCKAK